jgi:hypothetical protein
MKTISQMRWFTALSLRRQGSSILQVAWSWPQKHRNKDNHYISVKRRVLGTRAKHCKQLPASRERFVKNGQAGSDFYGERGARTYIGVWGLCPQWGTGAKPLVRGAKPPWSWRYFINWNLSFCVKLYRRIGYFETLNYIHWLAQKCYKRLNPPRHRGGGKFTPRPLFWLPFPNRLGWTDEIWWLPKYV